MCSSPIPPPRLVPLHPQHPSYPAPSTSLRDDDDRPSSFTHCIAASRSVWRDTDSAALPGGMACWGRVKSQETAWRPSFAVHRPLSLAGSLAIDDVEMRRGDVDGAVARRSTFPRFPFLVSGRLHGPTTQGSILMAYNGMGSCCRMGMAYFGVVGWEAERSCLRPSFALRCTLQALCHV